MVVNVDKAIQIVDTYGPNHQRYKAAEELSELQTLVLQDANLNGKVPVNSIIEEIADVYVILKQLEVIYGIDDRDVQPVIDHKIDRTLRSVERIEQWYTESRKALQSKKETESKEWIALD